MTDPIDSEAQSGRSPVEERHIDYILGEEFAVSPDFRRFFIQQARLTSTHQDRIPGILEDGECFAIRSASTEDGETDLLVRYNCRDGALPVAILIENKIRAGFQPEQAERYRRRGEQGLGRQWSEYWTCLVCHSKYVFSPVDFDANVKLEALAEYFASKADERSKFRELILRSAIQKFQAVGTQKIDPGVTHFRAMYAAECEHELRSRGWKYDKARDAWWGDTWFSFRRPSWPKSVRPYIRPPPAVCS